MRALYGRGKYMHKKIKYTDKKLGKVKVVRGFLPSPESLVLKESTQKITLSVSKSSLEFFKKHARKNKVPYQKLIRNLLDNYSENYDEGT